MLSAIQSADLEIYKRIAKLCSEHGLTHYALGGTLLGAVRHSGFIPWDDDLDIVMPRPDYDVFLRVAESELTAQYDVVTYHNAGDTWLPRYYCQVHDRDTKVELGMAKDAEVTTAWVDVLPLDAMPSNPAIRTLHKYRLLEKRMEAQLADFDRIVHLSRIDRPLHERAIIALARVSKVGSKGDAVAKLSKAEKIARLYNYDKEEWIVNYFGAYKFKEMFPKDWFSEGVLLPFEDTVIPCPVEYEQVLTQLYGDYMTPPPVEDRNARHRSKTTE